MFFRKMADEVRLVLLEHIGYFRIFSESTEMAVFLQLVTHYMYFCSSADTVNGTVNTGVLMCEIFTSLRGPCIDGQGRAMSCITEGWGRPVCEYVLQTVHINTYFVAVAFHQLRDYLTINTIH